MTESDKNNPPPPAKDRGYHNVDPFPFHENDDIGYIIKNTEFLLDYPPLEDEGFKSMSFYLNALVNADDKSDIVKCWMIDAHIDVISQVAAEAAEAKEPKELTTKLPNVAQKIPRQFSALVHPIDLDNINGRRMPRVEPIEGETP